MTVCCVETCGLTTDDDVILFQFPTSRLLRRRWLDAINPASTLTDDARICINHFNLSDYEKVRGETRLKGRVVPSVFGDQLKSNENETDEKYNSRKGNENNEHSDTDNESRTSDSRESDYENVKQNRKRRKKTRKSRKKRKDSHKSEKDNQNPQKDNQSPPKDNQSPQKDNQSPPKDNQSPPKDNQSPQNDNQSPPKDNTNSDILDEKITDTHNYNEKNDTENEITNNHNAKSDNVNDIPDNDNGNNEKGNNESGNNKNGNKRSDSMEKVDKPRKRAALPNGHRSLSSSDSCTSSQRNAKSPPPVAHDIEDLLTNYQIENKKTERQIAAMAEEFFAMQAENAPMFIEMEVGQVGGGSAAGGDCLLLLENVQVDVDPALLLADDDVCEHIDLDDADDDDVVLQPDAAPPDTDKKQDPISLLTSSDEDEVIIEEPHIDTVEVSDETDEDDVPLVKLKPKTEKKSSKKGKKSKKKQPIEKFLWGGSDYYCYQCRFTTMSRMEYKKHLETHSKVIQICQDCGFTTCSKSQLYRHRRKHKNEKKHKCPLCNYSARHNMSLIYHLKTHENVEKEVYHCDKCDFVTPVKSVLNTHRQSCVFNKTGRHPCRRCDYNSKRRSDLARHMKTVHRDVETTDDDIYE